MINRCGIRIIPVKFKKIKTIADIQDQLSEEPIDKQRILNKSNGRCWYCGKLLFFSNDKNTVTIDHVLAKHLGGGNDYENLVAACCKCNQKKGHLTLNKFRARYFHNNKFYGETLCQIQE